MTKHLKCKHALFELSYAILLETVLILGCIILSVSEHVYLSNIITQVLKIS